VGRTLLEINVEQIKKYDKPGPRYTSYPPATHFHELFTHRDYTEEIERTNRVSDFPDLSLYFHLPYCDSLCYFCGCNMIVTRKRSRIKKYVSYLKKEIDMISKLLSQEREAIQMHWGGGTPTHLDPEEISDLTDYIRNRFRFKKDIEAGCEIDPRELTRDHLVALRKGGFNRISMGVQDFQPEVQKAVNRIQPEGLTRQVISWVRELGFQSFNLDLMYGLPFQTINSFEKTIEKVIELSPNRLALFNFAYIPWVKKHMKAIRAEDLPSAETKLSILKMSIEKLLDAGYVFIGMDHFAKPDDELAIALKEKRMYRNFQGYSTHAGTDLYAMGLTSISQFGRIYAQNIKDEKGYFQLLDEDILPLAKGFTLNEDDLLRRDVITRLMCDFELKFDYIENKYNIKFDRYFSWGLSKLEEMIEDELVVLEDRKLTVTENGRLFIRNIAMNFDGYLERQEDNSRYSKTI
jgi:oxygen-independent coproporphyrinogen-3 oxidase